MATKTKTELMEEIKAKNKEIKDLEDQVKKLEHYKQYVEAADELAALRDSFVNSGFSKAEAFELAKTVLMNALTQKPGVSYRSYR